MAICGDVKRLGVAMQKLEDVRWRRSIDNGRCDQLVHGLVVGRLGGVMDKPGTADIDGTGEESHTERLLMGDTLQGANKIGSFKILDSRVNAMIQSTKQVLNEPLTRASIDHGARP